MKKLIYLEDAIALAQSIEDEYDARSANVDYTSQTFSEEIQCSLANPAKETAKKWGHIADGTEKVKEALKNLPSAEPAYQWMPDACKACSNHPQNGGSGICHCTLGQIPIT